MANVKRYDPKDYGEKEAKLVEKHKLRWADAKNYFDSYLKPRYDRSYKLYISYNGDRAKEIQRWQANVFIPYVQATVETMMPRIIDARPEFTVEGRTPEDHANALNVQKLNEFTWEKAQMDDTVEDLVRATMIYGISWLHSYWKKTEIKAKFLKKGSDPNDKKPKYVDETRVVYDAPYAEVVDNYAMFYDWRNVPHASKQFFYKRMVLNGAEIKRRYPSADPRRLEMALADSASGDLEDLGIVRIETKTTQDGIVRGNDFRASTFSDSTTRYSNNVDDDLKFYEVKECVAPFDDAFSVWVNDVPILDGAERPIPFDHKESPFLDVTFLRLPFEYEGMGYPLMLEQPQVMLNALKNQRLDSATMSIHKMWVVNPLANIDKSQLAVRPMGIIWSPDPNGVREIGFSDVKASAYQEEESLKADMRHASGVDEFSRGVGGQAGSATEVRHLRESTIERVRLFVNHLGSLFSRLQRQWLSMYVQFMPDEMVIRITDEQGGKEFLTIDRDDITGTYDFKSSVLPSIAGKSDVDKKQAMDLFQLLVQMPFVDPVKLVTQTLVPWGKPLSLFAKDDQDQQPGMEAMMGEEVPQEGGEPTPGGPIPDAVVQSVIGQLDAVAPRKGFAGVAQLPNDLTQEENAGTPPTAAGIKGNPRGLNMTGKVNTNVPTNRGSSDPATALMQQAQNIQR